MIIFFIIIVFIKGWCWWCWCWCRSCFFVIGKRDRCGEKRREGRRGIFFYSDLYIYGIKYIIVSGFANVIDKWSQCDFGFTNFGVILEYLESSITMQKAIFRLSSTWFWHVYTIVKETRSSCPLTWKAQIHDGCNWVINFDHNLPSSCFVVQNNSLI